MSNTRRHKDFICISPKCEASSPRATGLEERLQLARAAGWKVWRDDSKMTTGDTLCPIHCGNLTPEQAAFATAQQGLNAIDDQIRVLENRRRKKLQEMYVAFHALSEEQRATTLFIDLTK